MKKKLFLILAVVTLIAAVSAFAVHAADTEFTAYCDHCQQEVTWTAITANGQAVTDGHYYLSKTGIVLGANTVANGKSVCLNLNGYKFIANKPITVESGASLYIQGANGSIVARGNGTRDFGGFVDLQSGGSLYIKDATVTYQFYAKRDTAKGGIIAVAGDATLENCSISGGRATEKGGNIYVASTGTLKLIGGSISGGSIGTPAGGADLNDTTHASRCVYNDGKITVSGSASMEVLRMGAAATLDIEGAYTGTAVLYLDGTTAADTVIGTLAQGASITGANLSIGNLNMTVGADGQKLVLKAGLANDNDDIHQEGFQAYCDYCQKEATWEMVDGSTYSLTAGHYYLESNLVVTGQTVASGKTVCLYLNDLQYTANKPITVASGGIMHVQSGEIAARGNAISGVYYGAFRVLEGGLLNLKDVAFTWDTENERDVPKGGYLYVAGNAVADSCTFTHGRATELGGNIYVAPTGVLTMKGGAVTGGTIADDATNLTRCLYNDGKVILSGGASVEMMYISANTTLANAVTFDGTYTGKADLYIDQTLTVGTDIGDLTNSGDISGAQLSIVNAELEVGADGTNVIAKLPPAAIVNGVRYDELADAMAAAGEYPLVLNRSVESLTVSKDLVIDLNGCNIAQITVTGSSKVYAKDSKTDDFTIADGVYGKIGTVNGIVNAYSGADGKYMGIPESDGLSFHAYRMDITAVTLRPSGASMYFNSEFLGDSKVTEKVSTFGVALSVFNPPDEAAVEENINCTVFSADKFNGGADVTSSLVTGILKSTNSRGDNNRNANMTIYGLPYIKLTNGVILTGDVKQSSLTQILTDVESMWESLDYVQQDAVMDMYEEYTYAMGEWELPTIANAVVDREENTIRILTIGNSHGNDVNWQLRHVFQQQDPDRRVVVGFLYYSGCSIARHVTYAENNSPEYIYYKNEYGTLVEKDGATMLDGLQDEPWDIVLLQEMNKRAGKEAAFQNDNIDTLIDYVKANTTSDPKIGWHMVWANPVTAQYWDESTRPTKLPEGWVEEYTNDYNLDQQYMYDCMTANVEKYVLTNDRIDPNYVMASGTAIQYANNVLGLTDLDLYRDYTHISDFGRLISAYLWYAKLTGETLDSIDDIKVDVVPKALRQKRFQSEDLIITDEMKEIILKAVNHTLENPLSVPETMQTEDPATDNELNVLMIGNSFCYYYPDELVEMAKAAGKQLRICNVYYSGCKLSQHYTWLKTGEAPYNFFVRSTDGTSTKEEDVSLEYCLAQYNWDIITLQGASADIKNADTAEGALETSKVYLEPLLEYYRTLFPKTRFAWHQTWSYQVGTASNGTVTADAEAQHVYDEKMRNYALLICEKYDLDRINSGEAWRIIRDGGYDQLCARLGKNVEGAAPNTGDNYHDGDIGGGQYLNACVWYEYLFGLDVRENTFVPTYNGSGLSGLNKDGTGTYELLIDYKLLQEAAHTAFTTGTYETPAQ